MKGAFVSGGYPPSNLAGHTVGLNGYVENRNNDVPVSVGTPPFETATSAIVISFKITAKLGKA